MAREAPIGVLSKLAAPMLGVFGTDAAVAAGVSRKQLRALARGGALERVFPDTYRLVAVARSDERRLRAALVWAGPAAAASGRTSSVTVRAPHRSGRHVRRVTVLACSKVAHFDERPMRTARLGGETQREKAPTRGDFGACRPYAFPTPGQWVAPGRAGLLRMGSRSNAGEAWMRSNARRVVGRAGAALGVAVGLALSAAVPAGSVDQRRLHGLHARQRAHVVQRRRDDDHAVEQPQREMDVPGHEAEGRAASPASTRRRSSSRTWCTKVRTPASSTRSTSPPAT